MVIINIISFSSLIGKQTETFYSPYCYESIGHSILLKKDFARESLKDVNENTCKKLNKEYYWDCHWGITLVPLVDRELDCSSLNLKEKPFCFVGSYIMDFNISWNQKKRILEAGKGISKTFYNNHTKLILNHIEEAFGTNYNEESLEDCKEQLDSESCILKISYTLSYSLGPDYMKTEEILCKSESLNSTEKNMCYFMLGKRIGEIYFLNVTEGIGQCNKIQDKYDNHPDFCIEGVCTVQHIFSNDLDFEQCIQLSETIN